MMDALGSAALLGKERAIGELLGRQLGLPPIALRHLDTGEAQLADSTTWHKSPCRVDDEAETIGHRPSYRNIVESFTGLYPMEEEIIRTLGRPVAVDDDNVVAIHVVQSLTAHIDETYGQVVECVKHEHSQRGCESCYGNPVVDDELPDGMKVAAYMLRHDVE